MRRREDARLIRGAGRYTADISPSGSLHLHVVRSPLAHAIVDSIGVERARSVPGVVAVWTAADLGGRFALPDFSATWLPGWPRPTLAADEVCHIGEPLAAVFAESAAAAADAADAVDLELDPLPGVGDPLLAIQPGAPLAHRGTPEGNLAAKAQRAFGSAADAFDLAAVVVRGRLSVARVAGGYMEPRATSAVYDRSARELTVWTSTQAAFSVRDGIADLLKMPRDHVRVIAGDVGGSFGAKGMVFAEDVLVALGSLRLGRPVRWVASRSEDTPSTAQGHGQVLDLELAADPAGRLRGLRGRLVHDLGAYTAAAGGPDTVISHLLGPYRLPALEIEIDYVFTNTAPTGFIRGGGRPVGNFGIDRLLDWLACELGIDPAEIRRRNLISPAELPYDTGYPSGSSTIVYDRGDYPALLEAALHASGYAAERRAPRVGIGLGLACYIESTGVGLAETARVELGSDGAARLFIGTTPSGQGHETMAAQVLADRLDWPLERIEVTAGDTGLAAFSINTGGSRSAIEVGNATAEAGRILRGRLLALAAEVLEAAPEDIELGPAGASVRGAPGRALALADIIGPNGVAALGTFDSKLQRAYSSGCHVARVAVDAETGAVTLLDYVIAHDSGLVINPATLDAQLVGGWVHGVGYAILEDARYGPGGELLAATFLDYLVATAPEVPIQPKLLHLGTRSTHNPEGLRGVGESGTIPVPAAIAAAIEDALSRTGARIRLSSLPITSETVALRRSASLWPIEKAGEPAGEINAPSSHN